MVSQDKLIKQGIRYTDALFDEIIMRIRKGILDTDSLESFLEETSEFTTANPLSTTGYDGVMLELILAETNNHKFSRPSQKQLTRITIENYVGNLIRDVGEDVKNSIREIVLDGYNNNLSQYEIADNISTKITSIKNTRARSIARTEIARTASVSDYIINKERGAKGFTVGCRNTCCEKCALTYHGVRNDKPDLTTREFRKGKDIRFDMSRTDMLPPLHPNCRCYAIYF